MSPIRAYHRPATIEAAVDLVARQDAVVAPLGGGTGLLSDPEPSCDEVVDLQDLGLDRIEVDGSTLVFGSGVTLRDLVDDDRVPPVLKDLARRDAPNTIRNAATIGGTVATADAENGLFAGLLIHDAVVELVGPDGPASVPLREFDPGTADSIITAIRLDPSGEGAFEATARTPADIPIVAVAVRRTDDGELLAAATGIADVPAMLEPESPFDPPADFRGSSEYRRHIVGVLRTRAEARIGGAS